MKVVSNMNSYRYHKFILFVAAFLFVTASSLYSQNRDNLPAEFREYTNPEELVRFDRTTSFARAVDVINEFSQQFRGKSIVNQAEVEGNIGISVPAMHWMDALKLILRVNKLHLVDKQDFFEIVTRASLEAESEEQAAPQTAGTGGGQEAPVATTQTHEVRINAVFFEGNRRALQEIGVDWSTISENVPESAIGSGQQGGGGGQQGGGGGQQGPQVPNSDFEGPFVQVNSKGAQSVSQNVFNALINVGEIGNTGIDVQALFSAFEADNLGEILASPTVKVMDGQEGKIQVGQDFSIKQRDIAGNVVENFFQVGTILTVTPQVITQQDTTFIHLDIDAERSSAQPDPVSTIINKQEATTQSLLLDGEATVIAGLYRTEKADVRRGIPILKDLPAWFFGLRYLFGYESHDFQMRELVILIQASLEPTIPERYGQESYDSKFEVLQDERDRMQQEIRDGEEIMNRDPMNQDEMEDSEGSDSEQEFRDEDQIQQNAEPDEIDQQIEEENINSETEEDEKEQEKASETIQDPEVKTEKVELNLGGDQQEDTTLNNQKAEVDSNTEQTTDSAAYYIVGGSFSVMENATTFKNELEKNGFNASIVKMQNSDINLVSYQRFENLASAQQALADIKQNQNPDAWLYKAR